MSITNGYITLAEFKVALGGSILGTTEDAAMELSIESASRLIDTYVEGRFWVDTSVVARTYSTDYWEFIDVDGISTKTGLIVQTDEDDDGVYETTLVEGTDFRLEPSNAIADGKPFTRIVAMGYNRFPRTSLAIQVTSKGGWPSVPKPVKQATLILAMRLYKRKDSPFGISGSPELQGEMRLISPIDYDVRALLEPYVKYWAVR